MKWLVLWLLVSLSLVARAQAEPPHDPTVREVLDMAKRAAGRLGPERTRDLAKRARLSGLVPSLRLSARRGLSQDTSSSTTVTSDRTNASLGDDLSLEASLNFDLPRLVFASEEVRLLSVERWLANDLRRFLEEVTHLYFQRRRLLAEQAQAPVPDAELDSQLAEVEALLDAFTDGAFGRALPRPTKARAPSDAAGPGQPEPTPAVPPMPADAPVPAEPSP
jgi:hypothetical protein